MVFRPNVTGDAVGDFGEEKAPITFGLKRDMNESRHAGS